LNEEKYYFLDTNYLLAVLAHKNTKVAKAVKIQREQSQVANSVIKSLGRRVKIPILVIAEAVHQLCESKVNVGIQELVGEFEVAYLRSEDLGRFSEILRELSEEDPRLEPMDRMIVAFSLAVPQCAGLLTFDNALVTNKAVQEVLKQHSPHHREFAITSDPRERAGIRK